MDSILRDIDREQGKMRADVENLHRHYEKQVSFVRQYMAESTVEWAKLVVSHPKTVLLIVETTRIHDENGYGFSNDNEPIRLTTLSLVSGEMWDQLLYPTHSQQVYGAAYHGLQRSDLVRQPRFADAWPAIEERLKDHHILIFGREHARVAFQTVTTSKILDDAFCLHNKCKEYYGEFYELSLEKVLAYQGIDKKRDDLTDSRERIQVLAQVVRNLAAGMKKQEPETEDYTDTSLDNLDEHPF